MSSLAIQYMNQTSACHAASDRNFACPASPSTRKVWFMTPSVGFGHKANPVEREHGEAT